MTNSVYKLEILPTAKKDIDDIIYYISNKLRNKTASIKLSKDFIEGMKKISIFPYGTSEYKFVSKLKYTYRSIKIKNFSMFYTIDEKNSTITIVRVLYEKMNITNILE